MNVMWLDVMTGVDYSLFPVLVMSCEKRRVHLCDRDYVFPQYDHLVLDEKINATLSRMREPTDRIEIPSSAWPKADMPDDAVSFKVIMWLWLLHTINQNKTHNKSGICLYNMQVCKHGYVLLVFISRSSFQ